MTLDREAAASEALLTDLYLDALLAGAVLDAAAAGTGDGPAGPIQPAARRAAERLRHDLVRVHPSFRFEERLAARLAEAAVAMRAPVAVGADGRIVAFRPSPPMDIDPGAGSHEAGPDANPDGAADVIQLMPADSRGVATDPAHRAAPRPLLIGGALTSAALSIAGAAFVAWRFGRPGRAATPMARAARAVRDARLAAAAGTATEAGGPVLASVPRSSARRLD